MTNTTTGVVMAGMISGQQVSISFSCIINLYAVLWADRPYEGFDTSRDAFMGVYGAPSMPQA